MYGFTGCYRWFNGYVVGCFPEVNVVAVLVANQMNVCNFYA